jgi:hypothetical protein
MINVINYLKNNSIDSLETKYGIKNSRHNKYNNLVLLKYGKVDSDFSVPLVKECRGIILDEKNNYNVVAFPFVKFMNYGEGNADKVDFKDMSVFEKCDGSMICLYPYNNSWHVSTTGSADSSGKVSDFNFNFSELFWKVFNTYGQPLPDPDVNVCFFFELMTIYNKVVVAHEESKINLLGARDLNSLKEINIYEASKYLPNIPVAKSYTFNSFEDLLASLKEMPITQEGYVCVGNTLDGFSFPRVKAKAPAYCAAHHLKDGLRSNRSLVQVVISGEVSEVSTILPEYKDMLNEIDYKYKKLIEEINLKYNEIKDVETQKEFAMYAVIHNYSSVLFSLRNKKNSSVEDCIKNMQIDSVIRLLGLKTAI